MGEAGIRAVTLCKQDIIEELNSKYIPVFLDDLYTRDLSRAGPLSHTLQSLYGWNNRELQRPPSLVQVFIVTVSGEVVVGPEVMTLGSSQTLNALLHAYDKGVEPGPTLARYVSTAPQSASPDDLQMRVVGRFERPASATDLARLDPGANVGFFYKPTFNAPSRDWVLLRRDQWKSLLPPPDAEVGSQYTVPPPVAAAILQHFYSAWAPLVITPDLVRRVSMTATMESSGHISLSAHFDMWNPGQRGNSPQDIQSGWVVGDAIGTLRYEPASGDISDVELATTHAAHRTLDGFVLPYSVVAYRVH